MRLGSHRLSPGPRGILGRGRFPPWLPTRFALPEGQGDSSWVAVNPGGSQRRPVWPRNCRGPDSLPQSRRLSVPLSLLLSRGARPGSVIPNSVRLCHGRLSAPTLRLARAGCRRLRDRLGSGCSGLRGRLCTARKLPAEGVTGPQDGGPFVIQAKAPVRVSGGPDPLSLPPRPPSLHLPVSSPHTCSLPIAFRAASLCLFSGLSPVAVSGFLCLHLCLCFPPGICFSKSLHVPVSVSQRTPLSPDALSMTSGAAGAIPFAIAGSAPPICRALGALWWPDTQPRALVWLAEETEAAGRGGHSWDPGNSSSELSPQSSSGWSLSLPGPQFPHLPEDGGVWGGQTKNCSRGIGCGLAEES